MRWVWLLTVLLLAGCADTRGVNKELPMEINQGGDGNSIVMNISLELESDTMGESGEARISPQTSASLYGPSQAAGTEALMDDLKYVVEKWMDMRKTDSENQTTTTSPPPVVTPPPPVEPEEPGTTIDGIDTVLYTWPCEDLGFTYRDDTESSGIPQQVCLFQDFETCMDIPVEKFTMLWKDPTGNERTLDVANRCSIAMGSKSDGYGKFRPAHDKEPYKPVAYAPRGFNASEVSIIGKKTEASTSDKAEWKHKQVVEWKGNPNPDHANRVFSRCWWTETSGSASQLQRKFNFDWDGWKRGDDVLVVFEGGPEVKVTETQKRHYPGAAGDVKWGVPKPDDGNPCKQFPSIAAPKGSSPSYAILYYN